MDRQLLKVLFATSVLSLAASALLAQEKLTLKESIDLALQRSELIQIANESVTGAELKVKENKSLYFPQVNVSGTYTRISLISEMKFPFNGELRTFKFGTPNNYNLRASAVEQVFNWGRTQKTVEMSQAGLELAKDSVSLTRQVVAFQVVPLFYGVIFFREAIKVLDDNIRLFEKRLEIMNERYKAGLVSSFDTSTLQVQISVLRAQRLDFENSIRKLTLTFNSLAGRDPAAAFDPDGELAFQAGTWSREELLKEAMANRVEFQQIEHQEVLNKASLDLAKTGNKPTVNFSFNYEFRNGFMPEIEKIRGNWSALLSVSYPVFDGFRVSTQVAEAESSLRAVQMRRAEQERTVALEVEAALCDLRTIEQKIEVEKLKIKQAEDALRIAENRYEQGFLSATDLIESQNALEGARLNYLQLTYGYVLAEYSLYRSCGRKISE